MTATQTLLSASLLVLVATAPDFAYAEPDLPRAPPSEVHPEPPKKPPTGTFELGAGFSTDDGFIVKSRIAQDDLFGTGDRLALDAQISQHHQRFGAMFEDPHVLGTTLSLRADVFDNLTDRFGFQRHAVGGGLTLSEQLAPHVRAFVGYSLQRVTTTPDGPQIAARTVGEALRPPETYRLGTLRMGLEFNTLDQPVLPMRGSSIGASIAVSDPALGSEIRMVRTDAWISHHHPIGPLTLHLGASLSTVTGSVPLGERLQLDGSSELRGYGFGALGPRERDGANTISLGGTLKYTARAELEAPLIRKYGLSIAGFVDAAGIADGGHGGSGASAGVGLIWRSPIGPLRFDIALPLDGGRPQFLFSLGGSF